MKNIIGILGILALMMPMALPWTIDFTMEFTAAESHWADVLGLAGEGRVNIVETIELENFDTNKYVWLSEDGIVLSDSLTAIPADAEPCLRFVNATNLTLRGYMNVSESLNLTKVEVWIKRGSLIYPIAVDGTVTQGICDGCNGNVDLYCIYKFKSLGMDTVKVNPVIEIR